jgi:CheY-like chemotaxis protein
MLEQLFSAGAEFGLKSLVRGLEPKITESKAELFASIYYIPELRYFIGVAGEKREQQKISGWVREKFIPLAREAATLALRRSDHLTDRAGVLAVVPDRALQEQIFSALRSAGFKVWVCADGFEGLVRVEDYRPDLIILHSELGRISSAEVYARLKRKEESQLIPVVCLAPERQRPDPDSPACGDLYLELPLSGRKLVKVVENLLELK